MSIALPMPGADKPVRASLYAPSTVVLKYNFSTSEVLLNWSGDTHSPNALILRFEDPLLQNDWGGMMVSASATSALATFTTSNGCIAVNLN
jgi:hypothetical protein